MTVKFEPIKITPNLYQLGIPFFPMYLSIGKEAMLIEGGVSGTFDIVVEQIASLGIDPQQIKYIALTHSHADHIGALPRLKRHWPHLKAIGSPLAAKILSNSKMLKQFKGMDGSISKIMHSKSEIDEMPEDLDDYNFQVDIVAQEKDRFDLGNGIAWTAHAVPGHAACQMAFFEEKERALAIGDATGFYNPEKDMFWPNYFESLSDYAGSIKKLAGFNAEYVALSHNGVIDGDATAFFKKALDSTAAYHKEMIARTAKGEAAEDIAMEKAKWVQSIADHMPFNVMTVLCQLLIKQSLKEDGKCDLNF